MVKRTIGTLSMLTIAELERYDRQILLDEIGPTGQEKLREAKVCICGAGGLGSPAALYLAAAGIGTVKLIDPDRVGLSNLNRQILYGNSDIDRFKVDSARDCLKRMNPFVTIDASPQTLASDNAEGLLAGTDVIVDALDSLQARDILNKAAINTGIPLIHGAVKGFEGRAMTILPGKSACLRCMHSVLSAPSAEKIPVIGVTPAVIGAIQATETVKLLLGIGDLLTNRLLAYDGLRLRFKEFKVKMNPDCDHCGPMQQKEK